MMDNTIDARLVALYNEYLENGKEAEFIWMIYALLDLVTFAIRQKVYRARAAWKRKMGAAERKVLRNKVEAYFASMTTEQWIEFQNKPWEEIPDWLKEALPKLVRNPETNNFVRIYDLVEETERQKEISASRLVRYLEAKRFITSDEEGTKIDYDRFIKVCDEVCEKYDLPRTKTKRQQKVRITARDIKNYTQCRVTPKGDKMAILTKVTGMPLWYLAGYKDNRVANSSNPLEQAPLTKGKFKKVRTKTA